MPRPWPHPFPLQLRRAPLQFPYGPFKFLLPDGGTAKHLLVAQILRPVHPHVDPAVLSDNLNPPFLTWESGAWRPTAPLGRFGLVSAVNMEGRRRLALSDRTTGAVGSWTRNFPSRGVSESSRQWLLSGHYT